MSVIGNKNALGNEGGAPTKYKEEYAKQAYKLCLLGLNDDELAEYFEVSTSTISNWKIDYPEFLEALKGGKVIADAKVAQSLYKRATGFTKDGLEKVFQFQGEIVRAPTKEYYPPDAGAALNWLKNRQKDKWRDKQEIGFTDKDGEDVVQVFQIPDNGRVVDPAKSIKGGSV
jgi:transposase